MVLASHRAASAQPTPGKAELRPSLAPSGAPGDQALPTIVFDGTSYLAVWQDAYSNDFKDRPLIRIARVGVDGALLSPPTTIGDVWRNTWALPQATACGDHVFVAWQDEYSVRVARVSTKTLRHDVVAHKATPAVNPLPAIACAGKHALVAWSEGQHQIHAAVLAADAPLAISPLAISDQGRRAQWPRIATDGQRFLVLWHTHDGTKNTIAGVEVSDRGKLLSQSSVVLASGDIAEGDYSAIGVAPRQYMVAYSAVRSSTGAHTRIVRFPAASVSSPVPLDKAIGRQPTLVRGKRGYLALWIASPYGAGGVVAVTIDRAGKPTGRPKVVSPAAHASLSAGIAASDRGFLVAWSHGANVSAPGGLPSGSDVWVAPLGDTGQPTKPATRLTTGGGAQSAPAVASNGDGFLWAWLDDSDQPRRLRISRVRADGTLLDDPGAVIDVRDNLNLRAPLVASNGVDYLVTWNSGGIHAVRVDRQGRVLDPKPIALAPATGSHAVSFDGKSYVVVWGDQKAIHAVQVGSDGRVGTPTVVHHEALGVSAVDVDCASGSCLVVWPFRNNAYNYSSIVGRRLIDGKPDIVGRYGRAYSPSGGHRTQPEVEWTGAEYRVAWRQNGQRFGLTADVRGLLTSRPQGLPELPPPSQRATNRAGLSLVTRADKDGGITRVVGRLDQGTRPTVAGLPSPGAPAALSTLFARVKAIAAGSAWKANGWRDADLETTFDRLITNLDAVTGRGIAPLEFAHVIPGRRPIKSRTLIEFGNTSISIRDASGREKLSGVIAVDRGGSYQSADGAIILSDGDLRIGYVKDSIIIATGSVDLAHVNRSVVIAGGPLEISHEGSDFEYGRGFNSILLTASQLSASFTRGAVVGAADGLKTKSLAGGVAINTPGYDSISTTAITLSDTKVSTAGNRYEVAVGNGDEPRIAIYEARTPIAFGYVDSLLELAGNRQGHPLAGFRVISSTPKLVVLGQGNQRLHLTPTPKKTPTFPPEPIIPITSDTVVHGVGIYEPKRARGPVTVEVAAFDKPTVLVLTSYQATRWRVVLPTKLKLQGVVLIGHAPQSIEGIPPGIPIVVRVHAFGQTGHYGYVNENGTPSDGFDPLRAILSSLRLPALTSFHGNYQGDRFSVARDATGFVYVPQ
jgi:hypothetical protein